MATLTAATRALRLDAARWSAVDDEAWATGGVMVTVTAGIFTLARFGGLTFQAPRSFVRVALVGIWGWIALSAAVWVTLALAAVVGRRATRPAPPPPKLVLALVGLAHLPLLALAIVTLVVGLMFELRGPGRAVAVAALGAWFPASLVGAIRWRIGVTVPAAVAVVAVPYAGWLAVVASDYHRQIGHLL